MTFPGGGPTSTLFPLQTSGHLSTSPPGHTGVSHHVFPQTLQVPLQALGSALAPPSACGASFTDHHPSWAALWSPMLPVSPWKTVLPLKSYLDTGKSPTLYVPIQLNMHFCRSVYHAALYYLMYESVWIKDCYFLYQSKESVILPRALC